MVAVAAPSYLEAHEAPATPRELTQHACINYRFTSSGGVYAWEFVENGRDITVKVDGPVVCNSILPVLRAALDGHGIAYVLDIHAEPYIAAGELVPLLRAFSPPFEGYHLYYPSRRQPTAAFSALREALQFRR